MTDMIYYLPVLLFVVASVLSYISRKLSYVTAITSSAVLLLLIFLVNEIDALSWYFILISAIVWATGALFGMSYDKSYNKIPAASYSMCIAGMLIILLANDAISFLAGWEIMTISAYFGIMAGDREGKAAYKFLAFGELSALLIIAGFGIMSYVNGSLYFNDWNDFSRWDTVFFISALGFGVKMAMFPFHTWLPDAHSKAPANMSSLLSAILTLMGLYGMVKMVTIRIPSEWCGIFYAIMGGITAILGAFFASGTGRVKRLPAYSTIENDGILIVLVGVVIVASDANAKTLMAFAVLALLFYAFVHSVSKGLLFLIAGKIGPKDRKFSDVRKGTLSDAGVIAGYISALSLAGIPPFPGFFCEWLAIETLLQSFQFPDVTAKITILFAGVLVALTAGIAGIAMTKMITYGFQKSGGGKSDIFEDMAFGLSGIILIIVGVFPMILFGAINPVMENISGTGSGIFTGGALGISNGYLILSGNGFGGISPTYITFILLITTITVYVLIRFIIMKNGIRRVRPWSGGLQNLEYVPEAHSAILLLTEKPVYVTKENGKLSWRDITDVFYEKLAGRYISFSRWSGKHLMQGNDSVYVGYILLTVMVVLFVFIFS